MLHAHDMQQIPLGENFHTKDKGTVSDGTYVGFIILTGLGACLAWGLVRILFLFESISRQLTDPAR